jgi:RNA polymerase sigma-70 factor, ECF subfamily
MADARPRPDIAQLVADYHQAVYRYAYRLTGSVQDAEDLSQQVFLAAQRKIDQLRNPDTAKSWLFVILRNCFLKDKQKRRPLLAADVDLRIDSAPSPPIKEGVDGDRLQEALDQLPEVFRLATVMYYFEECSYQEIAEKLDVPIGTVMSRLSRARANLKAALTKPEKNDAVVLGKRDLGI